MAAAVPQDVSFAELDALVDNILRESNPPSAASLVVTPQPHQPLPPPRPVTGTQPQAERAKAATTAAAQSSERNDVDALVDRILQDARVSPTLLASPPHQQQQQQQQPSRSVMSSSSISHTEVARPLPTQSISPLPPSRFASHATAARWQSSAQHHSNNHRNNNNNNNNSSFSGRQSVEEDIPSPQPHVLSARKAVAGASSRDHPAEVSPEAPSHTLDSQARAQQLRRFRMWEARREARRVEAVYEALEKEQRECPFRPDTSAASLRRQMLARRLTGEAQRYKATSQVEGSARAVPAYRQASVQRKRHVLSSTTPRTNYSSSSPSSSASSSSLVMQHRDRSTRHARIADKAQKRREKTVDKSDAYDYEYKEEDDDKDKGGSGSDVSDLLTSTRWRVPRQPRPVSASSITPSTRATSARATREQRAGKQQQYTSDEDAWWAMLRPSKLYAENKAWGFDAYVRRMAAARALRERRRQAEAEEIARLVDPRFIHKGPTVPEPFQLSGTAEKKAAEAAAGSGKSETSGAAAQDTRRAARLRLFYDLAPQMRAEWLFSSAMEAALRRAALRVNGEEGQEEDKDEGEEQEI